MNAITDFEIARRLGVSRMTVHRMRKAGELPPIIKTQRRIVRTLESDFELWLDLDCPKTTEFVALKRTQQKFGGRR